MVREPVVFYIRVLKNLFMAILLGVVYMDQYPVTSKTVININGVLNLIILHLAFDSVFAVTNSFAHDMPVFMREHFNRMYRVDAYFLSKQLSDLPMFLFTPVFFVSILYYMVRLNPVTARFLLLLGARDNSIENFLT